MSKSLKNFITINEVLKKYTGRQIRIMVLMHRWDATFNYSDQAMPEAVELERQIQEFFLNIKAMTRNLSFEITQKWDQTDRELHETFNQKRAIIHLAICDSFDTPLAMKTLLEIISSTNAYLNTAPCIKKLLVEKIANYAKYILNSFGVFTDSSNSLKITDLEKEITPYVNAVCKFRDSVRETAKSGPSALFSICDQFRDNILPELGIRVEDAEFGKPPVWKFEDKEEIKKKIEEKKRKQELKQLEEQKGKCPPEEYFKQMVGQYSEFDEKGIPTHDSAGRKLSPEILKKLRKEYRIQQRLHDKWKAKVNIK